MGECATTQSDSLVVEHPQEVGKIFRFDIQCVRLGVAITVGKYLSKGTWFALEEITMYFEQYVLCLNEEKIKLFISASYPLGGPLTKN